MVQIKENERMDIERMEIRIVKGDINYINDCEEALVHSALGDNYYVAEGSARNALEEGFHDDEIYLAFDADERFVGFIWIAIKGAFHAFPYLHIITVKEEYRGKGIGKQLLKFFEDVCFPNNSKLFLVVADFNIRAKKLYEEVGYQEVGVLPDLYKEGITEHLMMKVK